MKEFQLWKYSTANEIGIIEKVVFTPADVHGWQIGIRITRIACCRYRCYFASDCRVVNGTLEISSLGKPLSIRSIRGKLPTQRIRSAMKAP